MLCIARHERVVWTTLGKVVIDFTVEFRRHSVNFVEALVKADQE